VGVGVALGRMVAIGGGLAGAVAPGIGGLGGPADGTTVRGVVDDPVAVAAAVDAVTGTGVGAAAEEGPQAATNTARSHETGRDATLGDGMPPSSQLLDRRGSNGMDRVAPDMEMIG
jgi:hypothetical protein